MAEFSDVVSKIESCSDPSSVHKLVSELVSTYHPQIQDVRSEKSIMSTDILYLLTEKFVPLVQQTLEAVTDFFYKEPQAHCYADQLVETLKFCLSYSDVLRVCGYGHITHQHQAWLIRYYIAWKKFDEAKLEWFDVIGGDSIGGRGSVVKPGEVNCDKQTTSSIIELVLVVVGSIVYAQNDDEEAYALLLTMVEKIRPWFGMVSDDTAYTRLHRQLVSILCRCTRVLVGKISVFEEDLIRNICVVTFLEYTNLSNAEMLEEFGCMLCTSVFSMTKTKYDFACNVMASIANKNEELEHQESKYNETGDGVPTLCSQMEILREQVQTLKKRKLLTPKICIYIQNNISNILLEVTYSQQGKSLEESRDLIVQARQERECGVEGLDRCIGYLDQAIDKMEGLFNKDNGYSGPVAYVYAEALCLRALCKQEKNPNSKVMDDSHLQYIFEMLIRCYEWRKDALKECLTSLWQSRSFAHTLCTSPLHDGLILAMSKYCDDPDSMDIWRGCMANSKLLKVDYEQRFSVAPTLSFQPDIHNDQTINELKQAACDLIENVPMTTKSKFLAAQLYYHLGERMFAKGSILEALFFAKEAYKLRRNLFDRYFYYSANENSSLWSLNMHPSVATEPWSSEFKDFILTPYNVLRCYLESTLQEGTIEEIVGNGKTAEEILLDGKRLSLLQGLSLYTIRFSLALGKIYRKRKLWDAAKKEIESLKHSCCQISCSKCRVIHEVRIEEECGDFSRSRFNNKQGKDLDITITSLRDAANKLKSSKWQNYVSNPKVVNENKQVLCGALLTAGKGLTETTCDHIDDIRCWHCLPAEVMKSKSLKNISKMKWECARRRHLLRILTGLGKCFVVTGKTAKAHEVFLESISLLVSRNTFHSQHPSISFSFLDMLVENNVVGDIVVMEHVSLLYIISWFSLQSCYEDGKRKQSCDELLTSIVPCLKLAFVLCSEAPDLFKKVSRLLSIMYTLSFENTEFSIKSSSGNTLSESKWGSYFHKATLGTHLNYQLPSRVNQENCENAMYA